MIFQSLNGSLDPRIRVGDPVVEPLLVHTNFSTEERLRQAHELLEIVGLSAEHARCYPHESSGGQRQHTGIAHALTVRPKLIIADEPVSSLGVSIQVQVLNLTQCLQTELQSTYLFTSHDLSIVEMISDRIAVIYLDCVTEIAPKAELYSSPRYPYTKTLPFTVPVLGPAAEREHVLPQNDIPNAVHLPEGYLFHARCFLCMDIYRRQTPEPQDPGGGHAAACHRT